MRVVALAGGTGGAKLAAGLQDLVGDELSVVVNTGDDIEALGLPVSPDPDLVSYWLCGEIDAERGWGIRGDSFTVFERLVELGAPDWFALSDRDLATCLRRRALLAEGRRATEVQVALSAALGVRTRVLPMCDEPVRTRVRTPQGWLALQEYLVRERAEPDVLDVALEGIESATVSADVAAAIEAADAIVIGPSNPIISIGPILSVPGMRAALAGSGAPVVAVSPYVAGRVVKGPTDAFMRAAGRETTAAGVAGLYGELIAGMVVDSGDPDPPPANVETLLVETLMNTPEARREVAARTLELAERLA